MDDTADDIRYRLATAGTEPGLCPDDAIALLPSHSMGSLREVDRLATLSLRDAARRRTKLVDKDLVVRAAQPLVSDD